MTVCARDRQCIFGDIIDGKLVLSPVGKIVEACWREIPDHFPYVRTHAFQVMPNHLHGIIEIVHVGAQHAAPLHPRVGRPTPGSLGAIMRSFKSAVTRITHGRGIALDRPPWQRSFYDHIIRDDTEHFFIERYITLNPLLWQFDQDNPGASHTSADELRQALRQKHRLDEYAVEYMLEQIGV